MYSFHLKTEKVGGKMLELQDICFSRDNKQILKNVNLKIEDNKMIVITGPNGSGKSTLAKIIMGIENPDSGKIIFNGKILQNYLLLKERKLELVLLFSNQFVLKD